MTISITPITAEAACTLSNAYSQPRNGLCATHG